MTSNTTKQRRALQANRQFTGELAKPIPVVLSGDADADEAAIRDAFDAATAKLPMLAAHLGVPIDGPDAFLALASPMMMALARETVPGFQINITRRAGRRKQKNSAYRLWFAMAYEVFAQNNAGRVTKSAFAQSLAQHEADAKGRGCRNKAAIERRRRQIMNDLSTVSHPDLRPLAQEILRLVLQGKSPDKIADHLKELTKRHPTPS